MGYLPVNDRDFALNEFCRILLLKSEEIKRRISSPQAFGG
jgi:hypothetical protein